MTRKPEGDDIDLSIVNKVSKLYRAEEWELVHSLIRVSPTLATIPFVNANSHSTTMLHQAICSRRNGKARCSLILQILEVTPAAVTLKNQCTKSDLKEQRSYHRETDPSLPPIRCW